MYNAHKGFEEHMINILRRFLYQIAAPLSSPFFIDAHLSLRLPEPTKMFIKNHNYCDIRFMHMLKLDGVSNAIFSV